MPMRVLAVADVYEALTADRPYRGPLPMRTALEIVAREVPDRLDPTAVRALETHLGAELPRGVLTFGAEAAVSDSPAPGRSARIPRPRRP